LVSLSRHLRIRGHTGIVVGSVTAAWPLGCDEHQDKKDHGCNKAQNAEDEHARTIPKLHDGTYQANDTECQKDDGKNNKSSHSL
jgi:hypothetical protein